MTQFAMATFLSLGATKGCMWFFVSISLVVVGFWVGFFVVAVQFLAWCVLLWVYFLVFGGVFKLITFFSPGLGFSSISKNRPKYYLVQNV